MSSWWKDNKLDLNVSRPQEWINGVPVERMSSYRYLGFHISDGSDFSWSKHISTLAGKEVRPPGFETLALLPRLIQEHHCPDCRTKPLRIIKDSHHPNHKLFQRLPSGRQLCSIKARTEMQRKSFSPQATSFTNS